MFKYTFLITKDIILIAFNVKILRERKTFYFPTSQDFFYYFNYLIQIIRLINYKKQTEVINRHTSVTWRVNRAEFTV